ncbi:MAG: MBL fold metallo-hydrolase [Clostridia bacterium]|jgi:beta-lactamase superfamily II metal-dependent hydrolase|nr:MBL fold metallo-hydrolase [Clostridia bacterium]NLS85281.1 MBL fold metallo-hydrolase [Oscillospiraceae bacterium]
MAWTRRKKYKYKGYTKIETDAQKKIKRILEKAAVALISLLILFAAFISAGENLGWSTPTWNDIYCAVGISERPPISGDAKNAATKIHFIDVGQADSTLIEQNGHFALIDAGIDDSASNGEGALTSYLDAAGVKTIDVLVITHPHFDHIGAVPAVLEKYDVKQIVIADASKAPPYKGSTFSRVLSMIISLKIPCDTAEAGSEYAVGDGVLKVLFAGVKITDDSYNEISVVTKFTASGISYLSCGDAEADEIKALMAEKIDLKAKVYKAAHHGSSASNTYDFLKKIKPQYAIVSCGLNNAFGHPQPRAVQAFEDINAKMLRTDKQGSIVVYVDENGRLATAETRKI